MRTLFIILFFSNSLISQNSLITVDEKNKDIGVQENIYKVRADYVIQNNQLKNLFLLRADAEKGITIRTSKKTLHPNDTALIVVEFIPKNTGKFAEAINLVTSADGLPFQINLSGNIKSIKTDDKTACFYFKKPNSTGAKSSQPIVVYTDTIKRNNSNKIPDNTNTLEVFPPTTLTKQPEPKIVKTDIPKVETALDPNLYKPNNIIILVDVSSSMRDSLKLPLLQYAVNYLIDQLRPNDIVTLISYADSVKILKEATAGNNKKDLNETVNKLKAHGLTKGNKAILFSLDKAIEHYLSNGNNQIILATDGKFRFYSEDQQKFISKQGDKKILLSTIALGNDKDAMSNLKEIASIGKGNFIHIKSRAKAKDQLLDEIKEHSLMH